MTSETPMFYHSLCFHRYVRFFASFWLAEPYQVNVISDLYNFHLFCPFTFAHKTRCLDTMDRAFRFNRITVAGRIDILGVPVLKKSQD